MPEWFCARHLGLRLGADELVVLQSTFDFLIREALAQPVVLVHRDYHSRNLMILPERRSRHHRFSGCARRAPAATTWSRCSRTAISPGRGCACEAGLSSYRQQLVARGLDAAADAGRFLRWFDLIGLQRHIKVLGIFARLWYRDGKSGYLADLPRTLAYVLEAAGSI